MNKANKYFNQHFQPVNGKGRKEDKSYEIRQRWKELGFPSYPTVDEDMGLPKNTTAQYASKYGYKQIKEKFQELEQQEKCEKQEKEQCELIEDFKEIWKTTINDTKYQLTQITNEIKQLEAEIQKETDYDKKNILSQKLEYLWNKHDNIVINKFPKLQDKARTNLGLTNSYKDTSTDKVEIEQTGELTLNQNITDNISKEELEQEYEDKFKQYLNEITQNNGGDVQDL